MMVNPSFIFISIIIIVIILFLVGQAIWLRPISTMSVHEGEYKPHARICYP